MYGSSPTISPTATRVRGCCSQTGCVLRRHMWFTSVRESLLPPAARSCGPLNHRPAPPPTAISVPTPPPTYSHPHAPSTATLSLGTCHPPTPTPHDNDLLQNRRPVPYPTPVAHRPYLTNLTARPGVRLQPGGLARSPRHHHLRRRGVRSAKSAQTIRSPFTRAYPPGALGNDQKP